MGKQAKAFFKRLNRRRVRSRSHRASRLCSLQPLEDRRLLAVTVADQFKISLVDQTYANGGLLSQQDLVAAEVNATGELFVDLTVNLLGDQVASLTVPMEPHESTINPTGTLNVIEERIQVDPSLSYKFSAHAQDDPRSTGLEIAYAAFDTNGLRIEPTHVNRFRGATDTYLIQPMTPCRDEIIVADATGWSNAVGAPARTRALAVFDDANTGGQSELDFTYTRSTAGDDREGAWEASGITFDPTVGGYRIQLTNQWMGELLTTGTAVRNAVYDSGSFTVPTEVTGRAPATEANGFYRSVYRFQYNDVEARLGSGHFDPESDSSRVFVPGTDSIQFISNEAIRNPSIRFASDGTAGAIATFQGDTFTIQDGSLQLIESDQSYDIDVSQAYQLSVIASRFAGEPLEKHSLGYTAYDVDGLRIESEHVTRYEEATDTTLLLDLNPGDTTLTLSDASGWSNADPNPGTRSLAWYGYTDSIGNEYPAYSYTRNIASAPGGLWQSGSIFGDTILLSEPWAGPSLSAGTPIRNAVAGNGAISGVIQPVVLDHGWLTDPLTQYTSGDVTGEATSGQYSPGQFPPGTSAIRPAALINQSVLEGDAAVTLQSFTIFTEGVATVVPDPQGSITVSLDVQDNDSFADSVNVSITSVSTPIFGQAEIAGDQILYTAPAHFIGTDRLTYTLTDSVTLESATESVSVSVSGSSLDDNGSLSAAIEDWASQQEDYSAPIAYDDPNIFGYASASPYVVVMDSALSIGASHERGLLYNDYGRSSNDVVWSHPLSTQLVSGPQNGALQLSADGAFTYVPNEGFVGTDSFQYSVYDGIRTDTAIASIDVLADEGQLVGRRLESIGAAAGFFHSAYKRLSPLSTHRDENDIPYLSWRVHLLPFLGYQELFERFNLDEPYDSENNLPLLDEMPDIFRDGDDGPDATTTRVQRLMSQVDRFDDDYVGTAVGHPSEMRAYRDFLDGLSNTILHVQTGADQAVPWTAPIDTYFNLADPLASLGQISGNRFAVGMADGEVFEIPATIPQEDFLALSTRSGQGLAMEAYVDIRTRRREWAFDEAGQSGVDEYSSMQDDDYQQSIGAAFQNYESAYRILPPQGASFNQDENGLPRLSWRVYLLPFMEQQQLWERFNLDEAWDHPDNLALLHEMPDVYRSLGDPADSFTTRFQTVDALGGVYGKNLDGTFRQPRTRDITDGTSNTALVVETAADKAVLWTKPQDLQLDWADPLGSLGDLSGQNSIRIMLADGQRLNLPIDVDPDLLADLLTQAGQKYVDGVWVADTNVIDGGTLRRKFGDLNPVVEDEVTVSNQGKKIALGVFHYHDAYKQLPVNSDAAHFDVDGNPYLSWRVHLLPFLGQIELFQQFNLDEPWDSPNNLPLIEQMPDVFRSIGDAWDSTTTRFVTLPASPEVLGNQAGTMFGARNGNDPGPFEGLRFRDVLDGLSNTIMFVEAGESVAVPWTQPADLPFDPSGPLAALELDDDTFQLNIGDGATIRLPSQFDEKTFGSLALRVDQQVYPFQVTPELPELIIQEGGPLVRVDVRRGDLGVQFSDSTSVDVIVGDPDLLQQSESELSIEAVGTLNGSRHEDFVNGFEQTLSLTLAATDNGVVDGPRTTTLTIGDLVYQVTVLDGIVESAVAAPTVESIVVNGGDSNRSRLDDVLIQFDEVVGHEQLQHAFLLHNGSTNQSVAIDVIATDTLGKTSVQLQMPNVIPDGHYQLTINGLAIESIATSQEMNEDHAFGETAIDSFFQLFGDGDGDRDVDPRDMTQFRLTFLKSNGEDGFNPAYDHDGDGDVDSRDYAQLSQRFQKTLPF